MQMHKNLQRTRSKNADKRNSARHSLAQHHQPESESGQDDGKNEPDGIGFDASAACSGAVKQCLIHLHNSRQIDYGEDAHPDNIEKMPEDTQAQ